MTTINTTEFDVELNSMEELERREERRAARREAEQTDSIVAALTVSSLSSDR